MLILTAQTMRAQVIFQALQADNQITGGPFLNVENTGNFIAPCQNCPNNYIVAMAWDGDSPGVAFYDGQTTINTTLPQGATDPDIVMGQLGQIALIAYEMGTNIHYRVLSVQTPLVPGITPVINANGTLVSDADQPNLDLNTDNIFAAVWHNLANSTSSFDVEYQTGNLYDVGIKWIGTKTNADNKNNPTWPLQLQDCYWPDIAISGGENPGVHVTFIEDSLGKQSWFKMDDDLQNSIGSKAWYSSFQQSHISSNFTPPRIATSRSSFNRNTFNAVLADIDELAADHVMSVYNNSPGSGSGGSIMVDWPMFINGTCNHAVVAWADDPYVNVAWSGIEPGSTNDFDIAVKRLDHQGQPYDNTWAFVNKTTTGVQKLPSISGVGVGLSAPPEHFAYLWVDGADELWFKVVPAANQTMKKELVPVGGNKDIMVYPNPTSSAIGIFLQGDLIQPKYELYNSIGMLLAEGKIRFHQHYIMVEQLPAGNYILHITNGSISSKEKVSITH